jgi:hypothetical protein
MNRAEEDALVEEVVAKYRSSATPFPQCIRLAIRAAYAQGREDAAKVVETGSTSERGYVETTADLREALAADIRRG